MGLSYNLKVHALEGNRFIVSINTVDEENKASPLVTVFTESESEMERLRREFAALLHSLMPDAKKELVRNLPVPPNINRDDMNINLAN